MTHTRTLQILCACAILVCSAGLASKPSQEKQNLAEMKRGIALFESVLNQSLSQSFEGSFETLDRARGAFLPGYGVVFSFEISLTPLQNLGPFAAPTVKNDKVQREQELRRREKAKNTAEEALGNFGQALGPLTPDETVAIVIHTVAAHTDKLDRTTIVISADKKLLDARLNHAIDQAQFVQKLSLTEY